MEQVYLVYTADAWLSRESRSLIAVATTHAMAVDLAAADAAEHNTPLNEESRRELADKNCTFGLETNYIIEPSDTDIQ